MRGPENLKMEPGQSYEDNEYVNAKDLGVRRLKKTEKAKGTDEAVLMGTNEAALIGGAEIPAARSTKYRMILILGALQILAFITVTILIRLLFVNYKNIEAEISQLKSNNKKVEEVSQLKSNNSTIQEDISQLKSNNKNIEDAMSQLKSNDKNIVDAMSQLKSNDKNIEDAMSQLKSNDKNIEDAMSQLKSNDKNIEDAISQLKSKVISSCCPEGWKTIGSKCYYFQNITATWEKSRDECAKKYSVLLTLKDKDELDSLLPFLGGNYYWIGLRRDTQDSSRWLWVDGTPLTFSTLWGEGEPTNVGGNENCVEIRSQQSANDIPCPNKKPSICKAQSRC